MGERPPRDLLAEVVEEFVSYIDAQDALVDDVDLARALWLQLRAAERQRQHRRRRKLRQHTERRVCPVCGVEFTVLVHARPGRVREACCDAHAATLRVKRFRRNA